MFTYVWLLLAGFSVGQLVVGVTIAVIVSVFYRKQTGYRKYWFAHTLHACLLAVVNIIITHLQVSFKIITRKINPSIYRLKTKMKSDIGLSMLVMLVTLAPNSFVVEAKPNDVSIYLFDKGSVNSIKKINKLLERSFT